MGTSGTEIARSTAKINAEKHVRKNLESGQSIRFGRTYTLTNIRLDGIFVFQ